MEKHFERDLKEGPVTVHAHCCHLYNSPSTRKTLMEKGRSPEQEDELGVSHIQA